MGLAQAQREHLIGPMPRFGDLLLLNCVPMFSSAVNLRSRGSGVTTARRNIKKSSDRKSEIWARAQILAYSVLLEAIGLLLRGHRDLSRRNIILPGHSIDSMFIDWRRAFYRDFSAAPTWITKQFSFDSLTFAENTCLTPSLSLLSNLSAHVV